MSRQNFEDDVRHVYVCNSGEVYLTRPSAGLKLGKSAPSFLHLCTRIRVRKLGQRSILAGHLPHLVIPAQTISGIAHLEYFLLLLTQGYQSVLPSFKEERIAAMVGTSHDAFSNSFAKLP